MTKYLNIKLIGDKHTGRTKVDWLNPLNREKNDMTVTKELTKKEQLTTTFKIILTKLIEKYMDNTWLPDYNDRDADANDTTNELLKEVSIRTDLR